MVTEVVPVKLVPLMVTLIPTAPPVGAKLVIFGSTTKEVALIAVPPGAVTSHSSGPSHSVRSSRMLATRFGCIGRGTPAR